MLLTRLAERIRSQDWFVVAIEILIVVVGIFLALQADNWSQERKNRALERKYLTQMQGEFDRLLQSEKGLLKWNEVRIAQGKLINRVVEQRSLPEEDRTSFEYGLYLLGLVNRARLSWGTVDELRSTGNIQLIEDWSLRQQLTDVENEYRWSERIQNELATIALHYREELQKHYRLVSHTHTDGGMQLELEYDESVFWSDPALMNMIAWLVDYQQRADDEMRGNLARLENLRDTVAEIRERRFGDQ